MYGDEYPQHPGLGEWFDFDAVSGIPLPLRHYAPEPLFDSIPAQCEIEDESTTQISES